MNPLTESWLLQWFITVSIVTGYNCLYNPPALPVSVTVTQADVTSTTPDPPNPCSGIIVGLALGLMLVLGAVLLSVVPIIPIALLVSVTEAPPTSTTAVPPGPSAGTIVGIVFGVLLLVAALALGAYYLYKIWWKQRRPYKVL